jgi:hypothetical protein
MILINSRVRLRLVVDVQVRSFPGNRGNGAVMPRVLGGKLGRQEVRK